jgi:uncharacterized protein
MKVTGSAMLNAPREQVWEALNDPAVLVRTIPGCQRLESVGPDDYRMTVSAGVASIKGVYDGEVRLSDQRSPEAFVLKARGAGGPGTVDATVRVTLAEDGGRTEVAYDADAIVGGMVAGVGQRMLAAVARRTAGEFFANVEQALTAPAAALAGAPDRLAEPLPAPAPLGTVPAAEAPTGRSVAPGTVFTVPQRERGPSPATAVIVAAVVGALIALAGVWVGWALAS